MPVLAPAEHHRQCVLAAHSSRLDPYALHQGEQDILGPLADQVYHKAYLQIRNAILRLWTRNPLVFVSKQEALESFKDRRFTSLVLFAHEWLARNGYINFGCLDITETLSTTRNAPVQQKTIVIIGAGVSGLACARQLLSIFRQFPERWMKDKNEKPPKVILLEGRKRIGGRVFSYPLQSKHPSKRADYPSNTAELGAQIITGFEYGNPLNAIVRGQLALRYHAMKDNMLLYDYDGSLIPDHQDARIQEMYNDILEAASEYGWKPAVKVPVNGLRTSLAPAKNHINTEMPKLPNGVDNIIKVCDLSASILFKTLK